VKLDAASPTDLAGGWKRENGERGESGESGEWGGVVA